VQVLGCKAGSGCLGGVALSRAQVGDVLDERGEAHDERDYQSGSGVVESVQRPYCWSPCNDTLAHYDNKHSRAHNSPLFPCVEYDINLSFLANEQTVSGG